MLPNKYICICALLFALFVSSGCKSQVQPITDSIQPCALDYTVTPEEQVGFQSIYPGRTTVQQGLDVLGEPQEKVEYDGYTEWIYNGFVVYTSSNLVESVSVNSNYQSMGMLSELVEQYGCPESIYTYIAAEDNEKLYQDQYTTAMLIYSNYGVTIFTSLPTTLESVPTGIEYYPPISSHDYLGKIRFVKEEISWQDLLTRNK